MLLSIDESILSQKDKQVCLYAIKCFDKKKKKSVAEELFKIQNEPGNEMEFRLGSSAGAVTSIHTAVVLQLYYQQESLLIPMPLGIFVMKPAQHLL